MAGTQTSADLMAQTAQDFESGADQLDSTLRRLMNEVSILDGSWKGQGGSAFATVKAQYEMDLSKLNGALRKVAEAIRASGAQYSSTDSDAASRVNSSGGSGFTLPL